MIDDQPQLNRANQLRLIAAEVIRKLWEAGETTQLELLMGQAKASIEQPYTGEDDE